VLHCVVLSVQGDLRSFKTTCLFVFIFELNIIGLCNSTLPIVCDAREWVTCVVIECGTYFGKDVLGVRHLCAGKGDRLGAGGGSSPVDNVVRENSPVGILAVRGHRFQRVIGVIL
jgi:hypothetical protein